MDISVLISVYSGEQPRSLDLSLKSIWDEQNLKPSQIVLVKDGPLGEGLNDVVNIWKDRLGDNFSVVALDENVGLASALNAGLAYCSHELVARMDSDDISLPDRFLKQVRFMKSHPEIAASSSHIEEWDEMMSKKIGVRKLPVESCEIEAFSKFRSPLSHPAAIFQKDAVINVGGYPILNKGQDYGLWSLLLVKGYKLGNIPEVLLKMRSGNDFLLRRGWGFFLKEKSVLKFQYKIGFLTRSLYFRNLAFRFVLRASPSSLKRLAYKYVR